jgi:hypothetical protein
MKRAPLEAALIDLGDISSLLHAEPLRRFWYTTFLLALREGSRSIELRLGLEGEPLVFQHRGTGEWMPIPPPPVVTIPRLFELIWIMGRPRDRMLMVRLGFARTPRPPRSHPNFESRFRIKLGDGFQWIHAKAERSTTNQSLIIAIEDISIGRAESGEMLRKLWEATPGPQ